MDLEAFIQQIEQADAFGPIIDPTMYREAIRRGGLDRMHALKKMAMAGKQMVELLNGIRSSVIEHAPHSIRR